MPEFTHLHPAWAILVSFAVLLGGAWIVAVADRLTGAMEAGRGGGDFLSGPLRRAALLATRETRWTERPDALMWTLAPAAYAALAAAAFSVVPLDEGLAVADVRAGIVV
ncbi:MAG: NADH-quinone oxidoreductase subunit H, partial [Bradymonadaceae bacterium]